MKRRVIQLVLLLIAGAIVNVAVAWLAPLLHLFTVQTTQASIVTEPDRHFWLQNAHDDIKGLSVTSSDLHFNLAWRRTTLIAEQLDAEGFSVSGIDHVYAWWLQIETGWPCKSMQGEFWVWRKGSFSSTNNVSVTGWCPNGGIILLDSMNFIPLRPQLSGSAINTIFYAAILGALFFVPGKLRRRRRLKRGLCPACAYPIGTSELCTECGKGIPSLLRGRAWEGMGRAISSTAQDDAARSTQPLAPSLKGGGKDCT